MSRAEIIELVDSLSADEQDALKEYALYMRAVDQRPAYWTDDLEKEYRQNILDSINKAENDFKEGRFYTSEEAKKILLSSLNK